MKTSPAAIVLSILIALGAAWFLLDMFSKNPPEITKELSFVSFDFKMKETSAPSIEELFSIGLYAKRDSNTLNWKLTLQPESKYNEKLSQLLLGSDTHINGRHYRKTNNAIFALEFVDPDGFVVEEAKAGNSVIRDTDNPGVEPKLDGVEPVLIHDWSGEVAYFGTIQSTKEKIDRIKSARVKCRIAGDLAEFLEAKREANKSSKNSEKGGLIPDDNR